jgi:hypothetical protein
MNIYLLKDGEKRGPYSIIQVVEIIRNGECLMSDLAWREGMSDWKPIYTLEDIVEAALPPLPKEAQEQPSQDLPPPIPNQPESQPQTPHVLMPSSELNPDMNNIVNQTASDKLRVPAILLCLFLGGIGLHAFYAGRKKQGIALIALFLSGFFSSSIGATTNSDGISMLGVLCYVLLSIICLITSFRIALGKYVDGQGNKITKWI